MDRNIKIGMTLSGLGMLLTFILISGFDVFSENLNIHNGYYVNRINDNYYLDNDITADSVGGVVDGIVLELGWNENYIVVKQTNNLRSHPRLGLGDSDNIITQHTFTSKHVSNLHYSLHENQRLVYSLLILQVASPEDDCNIS